MTHGTVLPADPDFGGLLAESAAPGKDLDIEAPTVDPAVGEDGVSKLASEEFHPSLGVLDVGKDQHLDKSVPEPTGRGPKTRLGRWHIGVLHRDGSDGDR